MQPRTSVDGGEPLGARSAWRRVRRFLAEEPLAAAALLLVSSLVLGLALSVIDQPVRCDEAATYLNFVRHGVAKILTDYSSPNNHILHTLAAKLTTKLFGPELWSLRLPALFAGVVFVAASYVMLRCHFDRQVALLGSAWIGTTPYLVDQATNARGYTMLHVAFVLLFALAVRLIRERSWKPWCLFAGIGAAGAYAVPVMGIPIAIVLTWIGLGVLLDLPRKEWGRSVVWGALGALFLAGILGVLYGPTLLGPGEAGPFGEGGRYDLARREEPLSMVLSFTQWLTVVWQYGTYGLPRWFALSTIGLAALSAFSGRPNHGLRFFFANWIGVYGTLFVLGQRPPLWSLSFLVPVYWTAVTVGTVTLLRTLGGAWPKAVGRGVVACALAVCAGNGFIVRDMGKELWNVPWYFGYFDAEEASLYVDRELTEGEPIVGLGRELITLIYYQEMRGDKTPGNMLREPLATAPSAYLIDAGFPRTERVRESLEFEGYVEGEQVIEFAHSKLTRWDR